MKPKHIGMVGTEGELTGKKAQGIYTVRGDILQICSGQTLDGFHCQ